MDASVQCQPSPTARTAWYDGNSKATPHSNASTAYRVVVKAEVMAEWP